MTPLSSGPRGRTGARRVATGYGGARSFRGTPRTFRGPAAEASLPGRGCEALAALLDHLAHRRRPVRSRARDRVRHAGGVRRLLVAHFRARQAVARERRDPRVADDDVL